MKWASRFQRMEGQNLTAFTILSQRSALCLFVSWDSIMKFRRLESLSWQALQCWFCCRIEELLFDQVGNIWRCWKKAIETLDTSRFRHKPQAIMNTEQDEIFNSKHPVWFPATSPKKFRKKYPCLMDSLLMESVTRLWRLGSFLKKIDGSVKSSVWFSHFWQNGRTIASWAMLRIRGYFLPSSSCWRSTRLPSSRRPLRTARRFSRLS